MEVFLVATVVKIEIMSLLHACGGVSPVQDYFIVGAESSPRMWRCFFLKFLVD